MYRTAFLALGCLVLIGCQTNPDGTQSVSKTAVGAAIGSVAGGVLGNRVDDGNRTRGTIVGAVAGAAAGGGLGYWMDRQEQELRQQLADERATHAIEVERVREDLLRLTLDSEVSFDVNSTAIKPAFHSTLAKVAKVLAKYDQNRLTVVGHTDATGSDGYNQSLSERRADAVLWELVGRGVPRAQLTAMGRGESEPRANNATRAGRQQNRRVEILVQATS